MLGIKLQPGMRFGLLRLLSRSTKRDDPRLHPVADLYVERRVDVVPQDLRTVIFGRTQDLDD